MAASASPLSFPFGLRSRLPKCCNTRASKFPSLGFPACFCFKTNRAFVPISITMVGRGMATVIFASGADPQTQSEGDLSTSKVEATRDISTDGPPIATILAGLVVFLLFLWLAGSLVLWILRLLVG